MVTGNGADQILHGDDQTDQSSNGISPGVSLRGASDTRNVTMTANRINASELFTATREIAIEHGKDIYRLRLTAQNKLILTK